MTEPIEHGPSFIERSSFTAGTILVRNSVHLTGGQRAEAVDDGWSLGPVRAPTRTGRLAPQPLGAIHQTAVQIGLRIIGGDEVNGFDTPLPFRTWTPLPLRTDGRLSPPDEWASVAVAAERGNDLSLAGISRAISTSLRAADVRIRDASDCYHTQLLAAVLRNQREGRPFRNIPLTDLYLAFHSLLSEMTSARDYLATFAGQLVGAPPRVDALNRLQDWAVADSRAEKAAHPLIALMLEASTKNSADPWLYDLTKFRNLLLHKQPLAASGLTRGLVLVERLIGEVAFPLLELSIPTVVEGEETSDALTRFVTLHERLTSLAASAVLHSKYSTAPPRFIVRD